MSKIKSITFSLVFSLMIITGAIYFTVAFKPLYYFDINQLNISETTGLSVEELKLNYNYMVDYNISSEKTEFKLPTIKSSKEGAVHFEEVRDIFQFVKYTFYVCTLISIVGIVYYIRNKEFEVFKRISKTLIILPIIVALPLIIDFDRSFVIFHEMLFSNDYWIFDPILDPVINILPSEFFFHGGILILTIILVSSIVIYNLSKINKNKL